MAGNLLYTYTDENGVIRPTAAVARELSRRQKGYEADESFNETIDYFGYSQLEDPKKIINTAASMQKVEDKSPAEKYKVKVLDEIAAGKNEYYDKAEAMEKPEYEGKYDGQIQSLVDKIVNGEKFTYDISGDTAYQQYKSEYERNAKKSSENAMAAGMAASGGYGNSYAQTAAQQAYNNEMQSLGEMIPEFEANAYGRYVDERAEDYNQLSTMLSLDNQDYGRYRDNVSDYYTDKEHMLSMGDRYNDSLYNKFNVYQTVEDSEFNKEMTLEEFALNKEKYANDKAYQDAMTAAEIGDFSKMGEYLGIDTSEAQKWYEISRAAEMYSATGMLSFLQNAGLDTTQLEENLENEKWYNKLTIALSIYEATGDPAKLNELGISTEYSDQLLKYSLIAAKNSAEGSSGSGGSGRTSGGGGSYYSSGGNDAPSEKTYNSGDKTYTATEIANAAYDFYMGHTDWTLDSRSLDMWLHYNGYSGAAATAFKGYLQSYGMKNSGRS